MPAAPAQPHAAPNRLVRVARLSLLIVPVALAAAVLPAGANAIATVLPADGLRLRAGPGPDHPVLDLIPGGTRVGITGPATADGWYPAVYRAQRGWLFGTYLAFDELTAATARRAAVTAVDGLNLRAAPLATADIIAVLPAGTTVTAPAPPTTDGWALVFVAEQFGWLSVAFLAFEGATLDGAPPPPSSARPAAAAAPVPPPAHDPPVPLAAPVAERSAGPTTPVVVTYYHSMFEGSRMACGGVYHASDPTIAATNTWPCGTVLRVCRGAACVVVTVQDKGGMGPNWIDLSTSAFTRLGALAESMITATAEVVGP